MPGQNTASVATKEKVVSKALVSGPLLRILQSLVVPVLGRMMTKSCCNAPPFYLHKLHNGRT